MLSGTTPHEAWQGTIPNLEHVILFGCLAYMKVPQVHVKNSMIEARLLCTWARNREQKLVAYMIRFLVDCTLVEM